MVVRRLSSHGSGSSSRLGELDESRQQDLEDDLSKVIRHQGDPDTTSDHFDEAEAEAEDDSVQSNNNESSEYLGADHDRQNDLGPLLGIYEDFQLLVRQYFETIVAEYVIKAQELQALQARGHLLQLIETDPRASQMVFDRTYSGRVSKCATKLLSLRHRAQAESLDESILEADELLRITREEVKGWHASTHKESEDEDLRLQLPNETRI